MMSQRPSVWRRVLARGADDRGSMMVALMAILMVTVAVTTTMAMIFSTQKTTRHDIRFVDAGQASDAGVQAAYFEISSLPADSTQTSVGPTTQTIGGTSYTYSATRATGKALEWTIDSAATKATTDGNT